MAAISSIKDFQKFLQISNLKMSLLLYSFMFIYLVERFNYANCIEFKWKKKSNEKIKVVPTSRLTDSMTSRKTSFLRYLIPSERHETALVTATGGRG